MLISVAELSQASSSTAWRILRRGKLRGALPSRRLFARSPPDVDFCNAEPAIAIEDEDTLLLEFNSSPLDELSLDARHSLSRLKLGSGVGWRCANCHFRGAGREPREENFAAT